MVVYSKHHQPQLYLSIRPVQTTPKDFSLPSGGMWPIWLFPGISGLRKPEELSLELGGILRDKPARIIVVCRRMSFPGCAPDTRTLEREDKTALEE